MAKKQVGKVLVECQKCVHGGGKSPDPLLMDCNNKERNPKGYKVGTWPKECNYFKPKV